MYLRFWLYMGYSPVPMQNTHSLQYSAFLAWSLSQSSFLSRTSAKMEGKSLFIVRPAWDATGEVVIGQDDTSHGFGGKCANKMTAQQRQAYLVMNIPETQKNVLEIQSLRSTKRKPWELKSWLGMPPSMADEELSIAWLTLEFPDRSRRGMNACSAGNEALTVFTTGARNSGDGDGVEPATGCEEMTAGCNEVADADKLSVALASKRAASWLLWVLLVLRELDLCCSWRPEYAKIGLSNRFAKINSKMSPWDAM